MMQKKGFRLKKGFPTGSTSSIRRLSKEDKGKGIARGSIRRVTPKFVANE